MHDDLGKGFRRVAKELTNQGWKVNKDSANRLYSKYMTSTSADVVDNKDLKHMKLAETKQRQRFEVQKEKEEIRRRLTILFVEKSTMTFEQRKKLFRDQDKLLRFAKRVMPIVDPMLWDEFVQFCEERGYDLANAVAIASGDQLDYETQPSSYSGAKKRFDLYLQEEIRACLVDWRREEQKDYDNSQDGESEPLTVGEETEIVTIELPDDYLLQ
jgi:hypothetical protein